ncbi:MAG: hypothetical protein A2X61_05885 [Ignavibacteria bacterium GWB2_35_12]|nr:MAG: hypothetical protein A2X63_00720 [Ignavibacteria bacterium GWA2_35_8]OGU42281.1 MAG: hypothetical protein A2X61_05885 [Ignavibacteria bacterium GWB2_35_12]OGU93545.1 MAG: hypothetical protein A2220_13155 [Ignavibacteria bacterium RIFOXYA2_FULL_35_10]OGV22143.1 MAG: hypothetical protein A2475_05535 [Ignavibacteria bacterium RIFOXYC2_FULL_35_21]
MTFFKFNITFVNKLFFLFFLISTCIYSFSQNKNDTAKISDFGQFLNKLKYPEDVKNSYMLELSYGLSLPGFGGKFSTPIVKAFSLDIRYGFVRLDSIFTLPHNYYFASEFAFLRNASSHLKLNREKITSGVTTDAWCFGFGYSNGYGYTPNDDSKFTLYNSGTINWSKVDIENFPSNPADSNIAKLYDEEFRFGTSFDCGFIVDVIPVLKFDLGYEHQIIFPRHLAWKWLGSSSIELFFQRAIDLYGIEILKLDNKNLPIINFIIKNAVSFIFYEFRRHQMNWPFKSETPMNYDNMKIGLKFVF